MGKIKTVKKPVTRLKVGEVTPCRQSGRYRGVGVGRDEDGFYAYTHRARCKSYPTPGDIPDSKLKFIRSTG